MAQTKKSWGGKWTEEKLDAFEKYVKAYLTIMNRYRDKSHWDLTYFDGFAGSGDRSVSDEANEAESAIALFGAEVSAEDLKVYRGAAERVIQIEGKGLRSFDRYYFVDKRKENCDALKERLSAYHSSGKFFYLDWDANIAVLKLAEHLRKNRSTKVLLFLDPFGMQINWATIESLRGLSVDLWILVPTGVIINRLLEKRPDPQKGFIHADKLESFFGMPQEEILNSFYSKTQVPTLFGEEETVITKTEDAIRKIAELYVTRLKGIFDNVVDEPLVLYNSHNVPIYHLVFAAKNKVACKIAQEIIRKQ